MKRLLQFIENKKFEYIDIEREESMPLLISAAAIQLTFGLDRFQLDYFKTIYVIKDRYTYGIVSEGRDDNFHDIFVNFPTVARPIYERMKDGEKTLIDQDPLTREKTVPIPAA